MTYSIEISNEPPNNWNDFLLKFPTGITQQTVEIANYSEKWLNQKPIFLRIIDSKGKIQLQNLMFENSSTSPSKFKRILNFSNKNLIWRFGPISESPESIDHFFDYVKKIKKNIIGKTHPLYPISNIGLKKTPWTTFLIDLTKDEDILFQNLEKHSAQKNIKRSINRGVEIEKITKKNLDEYVKLLFLAKNQKNPDLEHSHDFWKIMQPTGFSGFLARKDNIPVAGMLFSFFNKYIYEWGVARSELDYSQKLYSQDLIKWKIIEWGNQNKMLWYDLAGANSDPKSKKEKGILRYKQKWGGSKKFYWKIKN
jgi:lipid II:glycine glycyltransferase (peptidoglycan interpeptide bridge formation enzyme)